MKTKGNNQSTSVANIPRTGRIGRLTKILEKEVNEDILLRIMQESDTYKSLKPAQKALWWKNAVEKMEKELGKKKAVTIMNACGEKCCGKGLRKIAKKLMNESKSIVEFIEKVSKYEVKDGELEYTLVDKNTFVGKYNRCFCGQVKQSKEQFNSDTYCQCSVEFNRQFFQAAFEKPVEVELKQSILNGGNCCEFLISIKNN